MDNNRGRVVSNQRVALIRLDLSNSRNIKHPYHCSPPYTLKYVQSLLTKNQTAEVKLFDAMTGRIDNDQLLKELTEWQPGVIVYSVNVSTLKEFRRFNSAIKSRLDVFAIAVGSIEPRFIPSDLDIYLPGEAEVEINAIITRICVGETSTAEESDRYLRFKQDKHPNFLVTDLDTLPFPTYSVEEIKDYRFIYPVNLSKKLHWGHILSSRGCPYKCTFCSPVTRESYGAKARLRSAKNIVDEIEHLKAQGVNMISFDDDLFTISRHHVKAVCEEIQRRNVDIKWLAHSRIDNVDYEILKMMKDAGCVLLRFGIESGSRRIVESLTKSFKQIDWNEQAREIFGYTKQLDIASHALLIIGSPTETEDEIQQTFQLVRELKPDIMQIHFFSPYPGSSSYEQLKQQVDDGELLDMFHYDIPRHNFSKIDSEKLSEIRSNFYKKIFLNPRFFVRHFFKYFTFYANNLDVFYRLSKGMLYIR